MRVVRHQPGVVFLGQRIQGGDRGQIAVHREHAVGDQQDVVMRGAVRGQQFAGMGEIVMAESHHRAA